jgi:crotonobetainyl-CoA:carnitine CoA-transferase CaiB-like acyl-CoA transferase
MNQPLQGVTVVEIAQVITGPMAGLLLAELGASVIKVEPPGRGDSFRRWEGGAGGSGAGVPASFAAYNRGKRSVTLDTKSEAGRELYRRLVSTADVVLENFRPGVMDAAGIGPLALRALNPRLVYCSISGFGPSGPRAAQPTFDAVAQAVSGLWSQFTDLADPEPVGPPMADQLTALYATIGVLAALQDRARTGTGSTVEVNMLASSLAFQTLAVTGVLAGEEVPDRAARARRSLTFAVKGADGRAFCVHLSSPQKFFVALCEAVGAAELATDPRFEAKADRTARYDELKAVLQEHFGRATREEWLERLATAGVPAAPILDLGEALTDPQVAHLGLLAESGQAPGRMLASALTVDGERSCAPCGPPHLGAHTAEVLGALGASNDELASLSADGVI